MREAHVSISESGYQKMGLEELATLVREAGLREFEELACHGDGAVIQIELERRVNEDRLDELDYVDQWELVTGSADRSLYIIEFTAPGLAKDIAEHADELIGTCSPDVTDRGVTMSLIGEQDDIRRVITGYMDAGVSPELRKLGDYNGQSRPLDTLTDRQREVVETAYEKGYYEVPRQASTDDVAKQLGVDPSTVAEHLQRAERNLLSRHLPTESGSVGE